MKHYLVQLSIPLLRLTYIPTILDFLPQDKGDSFLFKSNSSPLPQVQEGSICVLGRRMEEKRKKGIKDSQIRSEEVSWNLLHDSSFCITMARIQPQATGDQALREVVKYNLYFGQIYIQLKILLVQKQHRMKIGDSEQSLQSLPVFFCT